MSITTCMSKCASSRTNQPPSRLYILLICSAISRWRKSALSQVSSDSFFFFSSRRRHTRLQGDWSSDVCSSDLVVTGANGSGKTTLLRVCAGLALPSEGELRVDVGRAQVGYLGHEPLVYRELTDRKSVV